ncbi:MAG: D-alanine--D-alanine ligase [Deltaproteobacteria bacterium]|nr:D-alanine--D-alanine ligase [Deltaproteobacteria bacterium]MBW1815617.1 D-alanine--D-alanine ligase [Deltaproteobacteria bacterium]
MENKIRVALLAGGWSAERAVSLKSGEAAFEALDRGKYEVSRYDPRDDLQALLADKDAIDLAFSLLHGRFGEDGCMQGMLEILRLPYVGSRPLSCAMAFNKDVTKRTYERAGLKVAKDILLKRGNRIAPEKILDSLGGKVMVKPVSEGSSVGMSLCGSAGELRIGLEAAFAYDDDALVEAYIDGREITCCVMGGRHLETLPLIEIVPDKQFAFFDYEAKYTPGATREICPARIGEAEARAVRDCAVRAHQALKCRVWSRTDMIIRDENVYLLETNTIPGMTENSLFPLAARQAGLCFGDLLDRLIQYAME